MANNWLWTNHKPISMLYLRWYLCTFKDLKHIKMYQKSYNDYNDIINISVSTYFLTNHRNFCRVSSNTTYP